MGVPRRIGGAIACGAQFRQTAARHSADLRKRPSDVRNPAVDRHCIDHLVVGAWIPSRIWRAGAIKTEPSDVLPAHAADLIQRATHVQVILRRNQSRDITEIAAGHVRIPNRINVASAKGADFAQPVPAQSAQLAEISPHVKVCPLHRQGENVDVWLRTPRGLAHAGAGGGEFGQIREAAHEKVGAAHRQCAQVARVVRVPDWVSRAGASRAQFRYPVSGLAADGRKVAKHEDIRAA